MRQYLALNHDILTYLLNIMKGAQKNTIWTKPACELLVSEVAAGHPVRVCNYAEIGHGQKTPFWERDDVFPGGSFPSAKTCQVQFEKLLAMQKENKKRRHRFANHID
jgi:hypothetical protein